MKHGEVWAIPGAGKVVVVSSDLHNDAPSGTLPLCVPVVRVGNGIGAVPPFLVQTNEPDPVSGVVIVPGLQPLIRSGERVGMLTGQTMRGVQDGLRALFDL